MLLDTNALLFLLDERIGSLTEKAKTAIADAERVAVSAVSFYEIGQLIRLGRVAMTPSDFREIEAFTVHSNIETIPTTIAQYSSAALLEWENRDPFDRIIIATAMEMRAALLTSDRKIATYASDNPDTLRVIW